MGRPDSVPASRAFLAALPAPVEQATADGDPLNFGIQGLRTAWAEADPWWMQSTARERPYQHDELLRRLGR